MKMNNRNMGWIAVLVVAICLSSGLTYALEQREYRNRITVVKPEDVVFGVRWTDRDLDQDQNITGITKLNGDVFVGNKVTITSDMINGGSTDLTVSWYAENVPSGMSLNVYANDSEWNGSIVVPRSTSYKLLIEVVDDGSLPVGSSVFDLVIVVA